MNYLIYNDNFLAENNFFISPSNRAFCYGDGLFETMIFKEGKLLFLEDHLQRLTGGLTHLDIQLPGTLNKDSVTEMVSDLVKKNNLHNARIKLQIWRKQGGLVMPESSEAEYIITTSELKKAAVIKENTFISENIKLLQGNLSQYKTLNFLPYIQAGIERTKRKADEIILTDTKGNLSEASTCNLFWGKSNVVFTPSLETGCIEGVMRKQIIRFCFSENIQVSEGLFSFSDLENAEFVFTSNVSGLSLIGKVNDKKFNTVHPFYQVIKDALEY